MLEVVMQFISAVGDSVSSLSPFVQGLLGTAVFAVLVAFGRLVLRCARGAARGGYREASKTVVFQRIVYRDLVYSRNVEIKTWGRVFVLSRACKRTIEAHCVLVFFGGVAAAVYGSWILLVGFYIALNVLIDARSWLKPWTSDEDIAVYDGSVKEELLTQFPPLKKEAEREVKPEPADHVREDGRSSGVA